MSSYLAAGPVVVDPTTLRVWRGGQRIDLQPHVVGLLAVLLRSAGAVVSRRRIEAIVWEGEAGSRQRLDQAIYRLRSFLEPPLGVVTVRGVGFRLQGPVQTPILPGRTACIAGLIRAVASGGRILLLGPPGVGKSAVLRAVGEHLDWPVVNLDEQAVAGALIDHAETLDDDGVLSLRLHVRAGATLIASRRMLDLGLHEVVHLPPLDQDQSQVVFSRAAGGKRAPSALLNRAQGLPLVLCHAARASSVVSVDEVAWRGLAGTQLLGAERRHRTLDAAGVASLRRLGSRAARVLGDLAVFRSAVTPQTATEVLGVQPPFDLLASHGLIRLDARGVVVWSSLRPALERRHRPTPAVRARHAEWAVHDPKSSIWDLACALCHPGAGPVIVERVLAGRLPADQGVRALKGCDQPNAWAWTALLLMRDGQASRAASLVRGRRSPIAELLRGRMHFLDGRLGEAGSLQLGGPDAAHLTRCVRWVRGELDEPGLSASPTATGLLGLLRRARRTVERGEVASSELLDQLHEAHQGLAEATLNAHNAAITGTSRAVALALLSELPGLRGALQRSDRDEVQRASLRVIRAAVTCEMGAPNTWLHGE